MKFIEVSPTWYSTYPEAVVGIMALQNVTNPTRVDEIEKLKDELVNQLRRIFSGQDRSTIETLPILQAYRNYYKHFNKTYHILLQLDSIVNKNKSLPQAGGLVDAMFMAEIGDQLLTAGHDLDRVNLPIHLDIAKGNEKYILLREQEQTLKPGDMFISDKVGVLSSIIYGPDYRTRITSSSHQVLYTTYAPPSIPQIAVEQHLHKIRDYVLTFNPTGEVSHFEVIKA